jgi:hypothetical protein
MASLIVRKPDGSVLFDTQYITHGLVKSAYLVADETWPRKYLKSANLNPDQGSSWEDSFRAGDQMFSITVNNALNPIVFIVGKGALQGTARSGNTLKFFYSGADGSTKAYVYDLMSDNVLGSPPWLKTRRVDGSISFNSLQVPLNIVAAVQAPGPAAADQYGRYSGPMLAAPGRPSGIKLPLSIRSRITLWISRSLPGLSTLHSSTSPGAARRKSRSRPRLCPTRQPRQNHPPRPNRPLTNARHVRAFFRLEKTG